ncbi:hypothetical protein STCU_11058 [Strigomonas culicis]|uniref:Surface antigen-like protein n=1 Tax=Strigomonas culicis TaxID=28005 RepID=S9TIH6_9TRYP|nr:hypothetical protein STCU_11058 [Strigomonas culicis]|eukprot:EPY16674.1 hypothetical protein STCU_11058 [Strigomonas culicis]
MSEMQRLISVVLLSVLLLVDVTAAVVCQNYYYPIGLSLCLPCPPHCHKCSDQFTCLDGYCDEGTLFQHNRCFPPDGATGPSRTAVHTAVATLCAMMVTVLY